MGAEQDDDATGGAAARAALDGRPRFTIYPIPRVDVYASVVEQLKQLVASLRPGDRLPSERELSEQFAVSRVPVREALRALESMGRIEIRRNAGSFVVDPQGNPITAHLRHLRPMGRDFLRDLVDVRAAIEVRVVLIASQRGVDLSPVRALVDQIRSEDGGKSKPTGSLDIRFEAALGRVTGNPILTELQRSIHELWVEAWGSCGVAPGDQHQLHREHEAILEALERGDGAQARHLMLEHVDRSVNGGSDADQ